MTHETTLHNLTELDLIELKEVPPIPYDNLLWSKLDPLTQQLMGQFNSLAQLHRSALNLSRHLFREKEALRAERDMLLAKIEGRTPTAH